MWRSVLLHEFNNDDIRSLKALPGALTSASLALHPQGGALEITPLRRFQYVLEEPLRDVIGVSCRLALRYPFQGGTSHRESLIRLGDAVQFSVRPTEDGRMGVLLRIAGTELRIALLTRFFPQFSLLRFDWHTSGQASFRVDGQLVGYHNALSASESVAVPEITIGRIDPNESHTFQSYRVGRLFVRALARPDSVAAFSRELPTVDIPSSELFERCKKRIMGAAMLQLDRLRAFMSQVHLTWSQPWSEGDPGDGPFAPEAILAHDLSIQCVVQLKDMLRSNDFSQPDTFLTPFTQFLEIVHDALPMEFEQLASELAEPSDIPQECRELMEEALAQAAPQIQPLLDLLEAVSDRVAEIAEA